MTLAVRVTLNHRGRKEHLHEFYGQTLRTNEKTFKDNFLLSKHSLNIFKYTENWR